MFRSKAHDLGIPLITYAEDYAFHGGFHLLMHGDTKLANPVSQIGRIGFTRTHTQYQKLFEDYDIQMEFVHKGENKMRFNPTKETKQADIDWFHELFKRRVDITVEQVFQVETSRLMSSLAGN